MSLPALLKDAAEAGIVLGAGNGVGLHEDARGMRHYSTKCGEYKRSLYRKLRKLSDQVYADLTAAAVEGTLCGTCVTLHTFGWQFREQLEDAQAILELRDKVRNLGRMLDGGEPDPVQLDHAVTTVKLALGKHSSETLKIEGSESALAFVFQGAAAEVHRGEAVMRTEEYRSSVTALCAGGVREASVPAATNAGLLGGGEALVHLSGYRPSVSKASLLDTVVNAFQCAVPAGYSSAAGELLRCPVTVAHWVRYASLGRPVRVQVAPFAEGDGEDVIDTAIGLFEPGGDEAMGNLAEALNAARSV